MEKNIITYFETSAPNASNNVSAGYNIGQHWFDSVSGIEYLHKSNGVWVTNGSYNNIQQTDLSNSVSSYTLYTLATTASNAMLIDYTIVRQDGLSQRSGEFRLNWNSILNLINYSEVCTQDIGGSTSNVRLSAIISGSNVLVKLSVTDSYTWVIKMRIKYL